MSTLTTNYSIPKPAVNDPTDEDLWGTEQNSGMDIIDAQLKVATDSIHVSLVGNTTIDNTYRNKTVLCDATIASFTVILQPAATAGDGFTVTFKKTDVSGNVVTIDGNAAETIDGATTDALNSQFDTVTIVCDGTNWQIKANKTTPTAVADASTSVKGIVKLATQAQARAATEAALALTPDSLNGLLATLGNPFRIVLGALTIQGGTTATAVNPTVTFATAFSGTPYACIITSCSTFAWNATLNGAPTSTGFSTWTRSEGGTFQTIPFGWLAIGPT